jgi:hypothetical protein
MTIQYVVTILWYTGIWQEEEEVQDLQEPYLINSNSNITFKLN